ncbi:unnamed protein product [Gemmataceae bacterium]|nr:unnamed protein product [Gemmataceae bacterium]VTT96517.1 unnamed protein product [Gemmataceae bacterium]
MRTTSEWEAAAARVIADGPVQLSRLARRVPADRRGKAGHASVGALVRWIVFGRKGVYLDGARLAGKGWSSSEAALARFSAALTAVEAGCRPEITPPCELERRSAAAIAELYRVAGRDPVTSPLKR